MADADQEWQRLSGRGWGVIERYRCEGAGLVIATMGSMCGTARDAVDALREAGQAAPLLHDPLFLGLHSKTGSEMSTKVTPKADDLDRAVEHAGPPGGCAQRRARRILSALPPQFRAEFGIRPRPGGLAPAARRRAMQAMSDATLRDLDGVVHSVPNGEITVASNMTRIWARVNEDVTVKLAVGNFLTAVITRESARKLELKPGDHVVYVDPMGSYAEARLHPADRAEALVELQKKVAAFLESERTRKSGKA